MEWLHYIATYDLKKPHCFYITSFCHVTSEQNFGQSSGCHEWTKCIQCFFWRMLKLKKKKSLCYCHCSYPSWDELQVHVTSTIHNRFCDIGHYEIWMLYEHWIMLNAKFFFFFPLTGIGRLNCSCFLEILFLYVKELLNIVFFTKVHLHHRWTHLPNPFLKIAVVCCSSWPPTAVQNVYRDVSIDKSNVPRWLKKFKEEEICTENKPHGQLRIYYFFCKKM